MTVPGPHLDLDALADLLAGEGDDAQVAHVGSCAGCAGRLDELAAADAEVAALLAGLPAPAVPDDLAGRLQAAFDAEPALAPDVREQSAAPVAPASSTSSSTVTPFPTAGSRRRTWLPAAAAGAVLLFGGVLGASLLDLPGGGDDAATSTAAEDAAGGGAGALDDLVRSETGTDYAPDGTLAAALSGLLGGSAEPVTAPLAAAPEAAQPAEDAAATTAAPAPVPTPAPVAEGAPEVLTSSGRASAPDPALDRLRTPEGLASCLAALLPPEDDSVRPLALDYAAYGGQPALVVVLPATGAADKVDVFVVGAQCTLGDDRLLFFTRLDRP